MLSMPTVTRRLELEDFRVLRDLIYRQCGIFFPEHKLYLLEARLQTRLSQLELADYHDYVKYLRQLTTPATEFRQIFDLITINETYFFRFPKQLDVIAHTLLPELINERSYSGRKHLNIWSAAAASGEEPYTLAIMIREALGLGLDQWAIEILGTDISQRMLELAKAGSYSQNSFRGTLNAGLKSKYFIVKNGAFQLRDRIRSMVQFNYLNLKDVEVILMQSKFDFIFCRNVLIYFDLEMKKRVIQAFYQVLKPGGYLVLGEAESLHDVNSAFQVEHFPGTFVYRKA